MRFRSLIPLLLLALAVGAAAENEQCGKQHNGKLCDNNLCCSEYGFCGNTDPYCGKGCQSQCKQSPPPPSPSPPTPTPSPPAPVPTPTPPGTGDISDLIDQTLFDEMLAYRNDPRCPAQGFYTYDAFITAAKSFSGFGTTGDTDTRKREIAAFLAQTSHETTGGWDAAPGGPYAWGYCYKEEIGGGDYCVPSQEWPCVPGKKYYGRGPIQIS